MKIKKDKLILCDLDGTLFDTLEVNYHSYKEALKIFNYVFTLFIIKNK